MIVQIADTSKKYVDADFIAFPGKEIGYIKKAVTYFNKSCPENKYKKSFYIFFFDFPCIIGNKVVPLANI